MALQVNKVIKLLLKRFPKCKTAYLTYWTKEKQSSFKVLIGTLLSQRTRDKNTEKAVRNLFSRYTTPKGMLKSQTAELEKLIKNVGFYRQKAKNIKGICKILIEKYHGKVPADEKELMDLPGVGQKTADCVLLYGYGKNVIPVDTHVHRVNNRLGWVKTKNPEETKLALEKIIKGKTRRTINCLFVRHGQEICQPRRPKCEICPVTKYCAYYKKFFRHLCSVYHT